MNAISGLLGVGIGVIFAVIYLLLYKAGEYENRWFRVWFFGSVITILMILLLGTPDSLLAGYVNVHFFVMLILANAVTLVSLYIVDIGKKSK